MYVSYPYPHLLILLIVPGALQQPIYLLSLELLFLCSSVRNRNDHDAVLLMSV